jgi:PIN domain nuclease of toxin-antitoxin system
MRLLLDTHFLVWIGKEQDKINRAERALLAQPESELLVSVLSLWELRIKWNLRDRQGRRKGVLDPDSALQLAIENDMQVESLEPEDPTLPLDPPLAHRDPFDEMLLVHAKRLDAKLLTRDRALIDHPLTYRFD